MTVDPCSCSKVHTRGKAREIDDAVTSTGNLACSDEEGLERNLVKQFSLVGGGQDLGVVDPGLVDPGVVDAGAMAAMRQRYIIHSCHCPSHSLY